MKHFIIIFIFLIFGQSLHCQSKNDTQKNSLKKEQNKKRDEELKSFKIGDKVSLELSKYAFSKNEFSLASLSYDSSQLGLTSNCFVFGVIVSKTKIKGSQIFKIKIIKADNCEKSNYGKKPIIVGRIIDYNATYFNIYKN